MKARRGATLIELLIVMSVCTTVLTLSVMFMHRVFRAHSQARAFLSSQRSGQRFAEQLRRDIHRATAAEIGELKNEVAVPDTTRATTFVPSVAQENSAAISVQPVDLDDPSPSEPNPSEPNPSEPAQAADACLLRLTLIGDGQVEYRYRAGVVTRVESKAGQPLSREVYDFPVQAELRARRLDAPSRIVVTISSDATVPEPSVMNGPPPAHTTLARFEIAAVLGRDTRYVDAPSEQETGP